MRNISARAYVVDFGRLACGYVVRFCSTAGAAFVLLPSTKGLCPNFVLGFPGLFRSKRCRPNSVISNFCSVSTCPIIITISN